MNIHAKTRPTLEARRDAHWPLKSSASPGANLGLSASNWTITIGVVSAILAPWATLSAAVIAVLAKAKRGATLSGLATVALATGFLALVNLGKQVSGDWAWYTRHYVILDDLPIEDYLGNRLGPYLPAITEPLYYVVAAAVSNASGGNIEALALVVTALVYLPIGIGLVIIAASHVQRPAVVVFAALGGMLLGLTFTLSTQLVRQEIAASWIGLAIVLAIRRQPIPASLSLCVAVATHNSALIPAAGLCIAWLFGRAQTRLLRLGVAIGALFVGLGQLYLALEGNSTYAGKYDGSISVIVIVGDVLIATLFLYYCRNRVDRRAYTLIALTLAALYGFAVGVYSQPLPFLRMYFYIEILRALMICLLVVAAMARSRWAVFFGFAILCIGVAYVEVRIASSPFVYELGLVDWILDSPFLR